MTEPQAQRQRCALCQVEIDSSKGDDQVHFSRGRAGTRSKLWARVCQYLATEEQKGQCINQDASKRGEEQPGDRFVEMTADDLNKTPG